MALPGDELPSGLQWRGQGSSWAIWFHLGNEENFVSSHSQSIQTAQRLRAEHLQRELDTRVSRIEQLVTLGRLSRKTATRREFVLREKCAATLDEITSFLLDPHEGSEARKRRGRKPNREYPYLTKDQEDRRHWREAPMGANLALLSLSPTYERTDRGALRQRRIGV